MAPINAWVTTSMFKGEHLAPKDEHAGRRGKNHGPRPAVTTPKDDFVQLVQVFFTYIFNN